jgi:hypothetical protein
MSQTGKFGSEGKMVNVPDVIRFGDLARKAGRALVKAGFEHRIDIYRDVDVEDPVVLKMLGQSHRVRVRITITAQSLLFNHQDDVVAGNVVTLSARTPIARKPEAPRALRAANTAAPPLRRTG